MKYLTTTYRPVSLVSEMDRVFNRIAGINPAVAHREFPVDIAENDDGYRISADIPGCDASDVDVRVEENLLVIEAKVLENSAEPKDENLTWHVRERRNGGLKRSFVLPQDVDKTAVEAEMKNGVLTVAVRKKPEAKPFSVKVQSR